MKDFKENVRKPAHKLNDITRYSHDKGWEKRTKKQKGVS